MALPAAITPITVSAKFVKPDGTPCTGSVQFEPSIEAATAGNLIPMTPLTKTLDNNGSISLTLAATDDADWTAPGFTYTVTERIDGAKTRSYSILVPAASPGGVLDLATVAPVVNPGTPSQYLLKTGGTVTGNLAVTGNVTVTGTVSNPGGGHLVIPSYVELSTGGESDGNWSVFGGDCIVGNPGRTLKISEGTNAKMGTATLVAGTKVVATTAVTANSRIQLTAQTLGTVTAPKALAVTARTAGTSFTITSADNTDTSVVAWVLFEPA